MFFSILIKSVVWTYIQYVLQTFEVCSLEVYNN